MKSPTCTVLLGLAVILNLLILVPRLLALPFPGNDQGYSPPQPVAFSHRLHAGEMGINCQYCHTGAEQGRHAGIPPVDLCMNCHKNVSAPLIHMRAEEKRATKEKRKPNKVVSPEISKLYEALGVDPDFNKIPGKVPRSIDWKKVHRVPDFVYFDHSRHVASGVSCQKCHGAVDTMEQVTQKESLSMGWCIDCHREMDGKILKDKVVHPTLDCAACHY